MSTQGERSGSAPVDITRDGANPEIFDAPLYLSALIIAPMSFVVLLANVFGDLVSGIWLLFLKQWLALGVGIAAAIAAMTIATILVLPSFLIAAPVALFGKGQLKFMAIPFLVLSNVWWCVALAGWGALALWGVPQLSQSRRPK